MLQKYYAPFRWGQGILQMGTPANANGDVHFCKKCTSPFDAFAYISAISIVSAK